MVNVTLSTIENSLPLFVKSLLTNNLTDPVSGRSTPFVYKDSPETPQSVYPYITVSLEAGETVFPTLDSSIRVEREKRLRILVVSKGSNALQYRDELSDDIINILGDESNTDSDSVSIKDNSLSIRSIRTAPFDYTNQDGRVIRVKEILVDVVYGGS